MKIFQEKMIQAEDEVIQHMFNLSSHKGILSSPQKQKKKLKIYRCMSREPYFRNILTDKACYLPGETE